MRRVLALTTALICAGCATVVELPPAAHCRAGDEMVETRLFFGMSKPKGGAVSARDWDQFVRAEITPRFPEGFSVTDGAGFWRDGATQKTISEQSKIVTRVHAATDDADRDIAAIIAGYKTRFAQESVLRVDRSVCAQF